MQAPAHGRANQRPWDAMGPPSDPLPFDEPHFDRGVRALVMCYSIDPRTSTPLYESLPNVLYRDQDKNKVETAYYPLRTRAPMKTLAGHVEICQVLKRRRGDSNTFTDILFEKTNEFVAVKVCVQHQIDHLRMKHHEDPLKEAAVMHTLDVTRSAPCLAALHVPGDDHLFDTYNIVMPYYAGGDIFDLMQRSTRRDGGYGVDEPNAKRIFRGLLQGLRELHDQGICHHDLSVENVMLDSQVVDQAEAYIIDFGMAVRVPTDPTTHRPCLLRPQGRFGKPSYMAPEVYRNQTFSGEAIDVWSAGCILFCMVTGNRSYGFPSPRDVQFSCMTEQLGSLLEDWGVSLSADCVHLLANIFVVDARLRLTIDEILQHPWLQV